MKAIPLSTTPAQRALAVMVAGVLLLAGCGAPSGSTGGPGSSTAPEGNVAQAAVARESAPAVADDDLAALAAGNRAFALDMYQAIRQQAGNLFFSPYSISQALAMTYAGARGATEQEMASTLHFDLPQARLHPAFNALDQALISRSQVHASERDPAQASGEKPSGLELTTANALWAQQGLPIREAFLNTLARNYGSGVQLLNFAESEQARQAINTWVSDQTKQRIEDLLPQGSITPDTALVLTNAIYFKASWAERFVSQAPPTVRSSAGWQPGHDADDAQRLDLWSGCRLRVRGRRVAVLWPDDVDGHHDARCGPVRRVRGRVDRRAARRHPCRFAAGEGRPQDAQVRDQRPDHQPRRGAAFAWNDGGV